MMKYVEFSIPKRDLLAMFIFEDTDDMELFIKECHEKQRLVVHASAIPSMTLDDFRREAKPIEQLRAFGMLHYVIDTIQGPDAILRYLCQTTRIHTVPIANDSAMSHLDDITKNSNLKRFFVKNFCVTNLSLIQTVRSTSLFSTHCRSRTTPTTDRRRTFTCRRNDSSPIVSVTNRNNKSNSNFS